MLEKINDGFAQGLIIGIALSIINLIFKFIKELLLSKNPMTRYVTFYISLILAFMVDLLLTTYFVGVWSSDLIEKPLYITVIIALVYALINVRKNRTDKNKFIKNSHDLITLELLKKDKLFIDKVNKAISPKPAEDILSDIMEVYLKEIPMHFKIVFDGLLRTKTTNNLVITSKFFKTKMYEEFKVLFNSFEKNLKSIMNTLSIKEETQTKSLIDLKLEMHRLQAKYKTEAILLSNDKIFIPDHIV